MIIIIDGYNLLKQVYPAVRGLLDKERNRLINSLGFYKSSKGHEIIVVFDGGHVKHATREVKGGVIVVFAGQKISADDWIIDYIERHKGQSFLLVTCDRNLIKACSAYDVDSLAVQDFHALLESYLLEEMKKKGFKGKEGSSIEKYDREDDEVGLVSSEALDNLMYQNLFNGTVSKDEELPAQKIEKGRVRTPSKEEKRLNKKIKKL